MKKQKNTDDKCFSKKIFVISVITLCGVLSFPDSTQAITSDAMLSTAELNQLESAGGLLKGKFYWDTDERSYQKATAINNLELLIAPEDSFVTSSQIEQIKEANLISLNRLYWNTEKLRYEVGESVSLTSALGATYTRKKTTELLQINSVKSAHYKLFYWDTETRRYYVGMMDKTLGEIYTPEEIPYWGFNEGVGRSFVAAGGGMLGTLNGGSSWTDSGIDGNAIAFDGSDGSYASIAHDSSQLPVDDFSINLWYRWDIEPIVGNEFSRLLDKNGSLGFIMEHSWENDELNFSLNTDIQSASVGSDKTKFIPRINKWNNVIVTYDGSELILYINGEIQEKTGLSGVINPEANGDIYLGGSLGGGRSFSGSIDEFSIHDRAFTASEIKNSYDGISSELGENCSDGIKNQDETGVDCGGVCEDCEELNALLWEFNENTGTSFQDSASTLVGSLHGGSYWDESGVSGSGIAFDGVDGYVMIPHHPDQLPQAGFSMEVWYKWDIDPKTGEPFTRVVTKGGAMAYRLYHSWTNDKVEFWLKTKNAGGSVSVEYNPVQGEWYYVVVTHDGEELKMYINGELKETKTLVGVISTGDSAKAPIYLGGHGDDAIDRKYFSGTIDNFEIWKQVLSEGEISERYDLLKK